MGITDWIPGEDHPEAPLVLRHTRNEMPLEEVTLAETLRASGYRTAFVSLSGPARTVLYDVDADPGETTNMAARAPEKVRPLEDRLDSWLADTRAFVPTRIDR